MEVQITKNDVFGADILFVTDKLIDSKNIIFSKPLIDWFQKKKIDFVIVRPDKTIYGGGNIEDLEIQLKELSTFLTALYYRKKIKLMING